MAERKYSKENLIGKKYGKLLIKDVIENSNSILKDGILICDCDCNKKNVKMSAESVIYGFSYSCGCERDKNKFQKKYNKFDLSGEYGIGYTLKGNPFYFDKEDIEIIKEHCWFTSNERYIRSCENDNKLIISIHRLILGMDKKNKLVVDHKNGKKYDNRKENLRICTSSNNCMNSKWKPNTGSGITGITYDKEKSKYRARITVGRKVIHLGYFIKLEDAVRVRKEAEEKYFGEFSLDNSRGSDK